MVGLGEGKCYMGRGYGVGIGFFCKSEVGFGNVYYVFQFEFLRFDLLVLSFVSYFF